MYHEYMLYQEYGLYWNISRYNQDVRSSFLYCDNYKSQVSAMAGVRCSRVRCQVISSRLQVIIGRCNRLVSGR